MKKIKQINSSDFDFYEALNPILRLPEMQKTKEFIQHGRVSVFLHSIMVAKYSVMLAKALHIDCDLNSLARGAFLHDFFLYDWHDKNARGNGLHGFRHPERALENALHFCNVNKKEMDIISKHMWPLTITKIPKCRESWLVCAVDKYCSVIETLRLAQYPDSI